MEGEFRAGPAPAADLVQGATEIVEVSDARGRKIGIKKVRPLERMRLFKLLGAADSPNQPLVGYAALAVAVRSIDGEPQAFPTSYVQIEAVVDRLGDEGLDAVAKCFVDQGWVKEDTGNPAEIKN